MDEEQKLLLYSMKLILSRECPLEDDWDLLEAAKIVVNYLVEVGKVLGTANDKNKV